ncbi:hypothetical protein G9A89_001929 [Geosiphon pyriformis]|nr:hypothetical protein G9A89_001929 [Geosiphon pyriformis]
MHSSLSNPVCRSDWAVVVKKISVGILAEAVHAALSEFGMIKSIKIQLQSNYADLVTAKWSILIGKDAVCVMLLYTLPMGTNAHNIWNFIRSIRCAVVCFNSAESLNAVMRTTLVLRDTNLHWFSLMSARCVKYGKPGHISLSCTESEKISSGSSLCRMLSDADKSRLAAIYAKQSAPVAHSVSFGGLFWAKVAGRSSFLFLSGRIVLLNIGFSLEMKPFLLVAMEINNKFATLECSLTSLTKCVDMLAKRLNASESMVSQLSPRCQPLITSLSQNQGVDIVMNKSLGVATSGETVVRAVVFDSSVIGKIKNTLNNLTIMVMGFSAKIDNACLFATCNVQGLNVPTKQKDIVYWHKEFRNMIMNRFDKVHIFTSGLDNGYLRTGMVIVMNNSLAQHVSKMEKIPNHVILVHLLFKGKVLVTIIGLYTCASPGDWFGQAFGLSLVNSFGGHSLAGVSTWSNSKGIEKVIDHIFVNESLISAVASYKVESVTEFFNTDYRAVLVSIGLDDLLNMHLNGICRYANKNCWKFKLKNVDVNGWGCFMECFSNKFLKRSVVFHNAECNGNLDAMWNVLKKVTIDSADKIFSKLWFNEFNSMKNKISSKFHGLELLMSKIVNSMKTSLSLETDCFVNTWAGIDNEGAFKIQIMINKGTRIENIVCHILVVKKRYYRSKYHESKVIKDESIKVAVTKRIENFCSNKERMIKNILDQPFKKVVLDYLIIDDKLILESQTVKSLVDTIIKDWMRKHLVSGILSGWWLNQYASLDYVDDDIFSEVMCGISLNELLEVVKDLSDDKTAGLSRISNKL